MDKSINFFEIREEMDKLGFPTREIIDEVRKALYENVLYKTISFRDDKAMLHLTFGQDEYTRFKFFDYSVQYPDDKRKLRFQAFEGEVPLAKAKELILSRIQMKVIDLPDVQTPLFLADVRREQIGLDLNMPQPGTIYNGIDTADLDKRMQRVDWNKHPGHWFYARDAPNDKQLQELRALERQV